MNTFRIDLGVVERCHIISKKIVRNATCVCLSVRSKVVKSTYHRHKRKKKEGCAIISCSYCSKALVGLEKQKIIISAFSRTSRVKKYILQKIVHTTLLVHI